MPPRSEIYNTAKAPIANEESVPINFFKERITLKQPYNRARGNTFPIIYAAFFFSPAFGFKRAQP